jgi:hypothetical protein
VSSGDIETLAARLASKVRQTIGSCSRTDLWFESGSLQRRVGETFGPSAEDAGFSARLASLVKHTGGLDGEAVKALKTWQSAHHPASIGAPGKALCAMSRLDDIDTKAANLSASAI